jgi:hypothetical protein
MPVSPLTATQTPTPNAVPIADGSGSLNDWVTNGSGGDIQALLDTLSTTPGAVIARDIGGWVAVEPGVDGFVLTTHGSGALPTWMPAGSAPVSSLYTALVEDWELNESSGSRAGSFAGLTLSDNGGVSGTPGVDSSLASLFVMASSQFLSRASSAALDNGGVTGFEFSFWLRPDDLSTETAVLSKDAVATGPNRQYAVFQETDGTLFIVVHNTAGTSPATLSTAFTLTQGTWHMVNFWFDNSDKKIRASLNDGTPEVSAALGGTLNTTGGFDFELGARSADPSYSNMGLNRVRFWNRILTPAERTTLYNSGNGISYPF